MASVRPALSLLTLFTNRQDGTLRVGEAENRARLFARLNIVPDQVVDAEQIHGSGVARVTRADGGKVVPGADALITDDAELVLMLEFADCVPVLLHDPRCEAVGSAHAGWRGTAAGIAGATVARMAGDFGSDPADLRAWIGPAIGQCCYEVSDQVAEAISTRTPDAQLTYPGPAGRPMLDLQAANRAQLGAAGVRAENIHWRVTCTACRADLYFSHRGENGRTGRQASLIALREDTR